VVAFDKLKKRYIQYITKYNHGYTLGALADRRHISLAPIQISSMTSPRAKKYVAVKSHARAITRLHGYIIVGLREDAVSVVLVPSSSGALTSCTAEAICDEDERILWYDLVLVGHLPYYERNMHRSL
jgi:hypothetical protein